MKPDFHSSFIYGDDTIEYDWFTVTRKEDIPDIAWKQVYAIANLHGKVVLVTSVTSEKPYNLPGGTVEAGETLERCLERELIEECNMRLVSWEPLGYQVCYMPDGQVVPQFRVYAVVEKIGEFVSDPGGGVVSNTLVTIDQLEPTIQYGETGRILTQLAEIYFEDRP